jgi:hypothetical protein
VRQGEDKLREAETSSANGTFFCSFCGKNQRDVLKLIAGPGRVFICNECVDLCASICAGTVDERDRREEQATLMATERRDREFGTIRDALADVQRQIERLWLAGRLDSSA